MSTILSSQKLTYDVCRIFVFFGPLPSPLSAFHATYGRHMHLYFLTGPEHGEVSGSFFRGYEEGEMEEQEEDMEDEEGEYHGHHPHDHLGGIDYQDGSGGGGGGKG